MLDLLLFCTSAVVGTSIGFKIHSLFIAHRNRLPLAKQLCGCGHYYWQHQHQYANSPCVRENNCRCQKYCYDEEKSRQQSLDTVLAESAKLLEEAKPPTKQITATVKTTFYPLVKP